MSPATAPVALLAVLSTALVGGVPPTSDDEGRWRASSPQQVDLRLDFDEGRGRAGTRIRKVSNGAAARLSVTVVTRDGGRLVRVRGLDGHAARFPTVTRTGVPRAAAVVVRDRHAGDALSPGRRRVVFGADVRLDARSDGNALDDGDNLVQRGLYHDRAQYKLQLDRRVPSCRIAGSSGTVLVRADVPMRAAQWYRLRCARTGTLVRLCLRRAVDGAWSRPLSWSATGPTGRVAPGRRVPMTIGAKVAPSGAIPRDADQLNGVVDNVFYDRR